MARERTIVAAGGVIWRPRAGSRNGVELLLAHRPRYDDWTFPKGKQDPGESVQATAWREIAEETGLHVRLGLPLPAVHYRVGAGPKVVHYWSARLDEDDPGEFVPNKEVDEVRWARPRDARALLTYAHDRDLLAAFRGVRDAGRHQSRTLVLLRHGKAASASRHRGPDLSRPLTDAGRERALDLAGSLGPYAPTRLISSPAVRCQETLAPLADLLGLKVSTDRRLIEDAPRAAVTALAREAMSRRRAVVCTHLPTLHELGEALGVPMTHLAPGEGVVLHHRHGRVIASELLTHV